jgi:hypothetical protein
MALNGVSLLSSGLLLLRSRPERSPSRSPAPWQFPGSATFVILVATGLFAAAQVHLTGRSLQFDEILALEADVRTPLAQGLEPRAALNHISGALLARAGRWAFGESPHGLRAAGIIVAVAGLGAAALWVARTTRAAWPAAWWILTIGGNSLVLDLSAQIRGYTSLMWLGTASVLAAGAVLAAPQKRSAAALAGLAAAGVMLGLSHLFGLFYLTTLTWVVHALLWLPGSIRPRTDRPSEPLATRPTTTQAVAATLLALLTAGCTWVWMPAFPWLFYLTGGGEPQNRADLVTGELSRLVSGGYEARAVALTSVLAMCASGVFLWRTRPELRLLSVMATAPLLFLIAAALTLEPTFFHARFLALGLVLGCTTLACSIAGLADRASLSPRSRAALWLTLSLATVALLATPTRDLLRETQGYREAVRDLARMHRVWDRSGQGRVIPVGGWESKTILRFYLPLDLISDHPGAAALVSRRQRGIVDVLAWIAEGDVPVSPEYLPPMESWRRTLRGSRSESPIQVLGFGAIEHEPVLRPPPHPSDGSRQELPAGGAGSPPPLR